MNDENGLIIDPNRLFVSRSANNSGSPPSSARSNISGNIPERMQFGLAWLNLTFAPQSFMSNKSKTILRNVSGQIKFGEIMGVMGPSGCGKSTLLYCINGRIASGLSSKTHIYVSTSRPIHSCFIVQDQKEHLLMNLTTKELLLYASKIKNNTIETNRKTNSLDFSEERINSSTLNFVGKRKNFDHISNIRKLMTDLTLTDCSDTLVSNCSGGQQKRIVIALELSAQNKPNIMCIDEPTSGLDSNAAEQVIECLRNICRDHSIGIITTIHQPNSDILYMFDTLYILAKGGLCIYNERPLFIREFLLDSEFSIKETQIPIEIIIKLASKVTFADEDSEELQVHDDIKLLAKKAELSNRDLKLKCYAFGKLTHPKEITIKPIDFNLHHFWVLVHRSFKCSIIRGWKIILFLILFEMNIALLSAHLFGKPGGEDGCLNFDPTQPHNTTCIPTESTSLSKEEPKVFKNFKFLYFMGLSHNFLQSCYTLLTYPMEVKLFFNEQQNRWYSTGAYFWARNLTDCFIAILTTVSFETTVYFTTGQIGTIYEKYYGLFLLSNILSIFCSQGLSSIVSIIAARNFKMCLILGIGIQIMSTIVSGFFIPINEMGPVFQFISYLSLQRLTLETQIYILYGFNRCNPKENRWSFILYRFDFNEDGFYFNIYLLLIYTILFRLLALICLIIKTNDWKLNPNIKSCHKKNSKVKYNREVSIIF